MYVKQGAELTTGHGGHDLSGHTFILVLGFLLLAESIVAYVPQLVCYPVVQRAIPAQLRASRSVLRAGAMLESAANLVALAATCALLLLWSAMLFFTALFFHSATEKITGVVAALTVWVFMPKEHV